MLPALDYFRSTGARSDERVAEAVDLVERKRGADGRWLLDVRYHGEMPIDVGEREGSPSRWITLRALRVLDWYSVRGASTA